MYDYISPQKVLTALRCLKQNNLDIDINEEWLEQAVSNDEDLFGGLVEQRDTYDIHNDTDDMNSESVLPTCTQQPYSVDNSDRGTNQLVDIDGCQSMECDPHSLFSDDDLFTIAFNMLEQVASENGFAC